MLNANHSVVVIGAGHAGVMLSTLLRQRGYPGRITLLGDEPHLPYERPPLSKSLLRENLHHSLYPAQFYVEQQIRLRLGTVVQSIDPGLRQVHMTSGEHLEYDTLVIATGLSARRLDVPGAHLKGVHRLRDLDNAMSLKASLLRARHLVVFGGGWIGTEVASSARMANIPTTLVVRDETLLARSASPDLSLALTDIHRQHGTNIITGRRAIRLEGDTTGHVAAVQLSDGSKLACDAVAVGIGSVPNIQLAETAGILCQEGIVVDHLGRTSYPNVYAIGDVTARPLASRRGLFRIESIPSATEQAKQVAAHLMGQDAPREEVPWFWSDQFDKKIRIAGMRADGELAVMRAPETESSLAIFHIMGNEVTGIETIDAAAEFNVGKRMIRDREEVDAERLADETECLPYGMSQDVEMETAALDVAADAEIDPSVDCGSELGPWRATFMQQDGQRQEVSLNRGDTLLDAALRQNVPNVLAECGGQAACGTCHILVRKDWTAATGEPGDIEASMLEFTEGAGVTSRLACQIRGSRSLDGIVVTVVPC